MSEDQAPSRVWRLMVWDVPSQLGGLLSRHGFRQTKANPEHWWRLFDPERPADKAFALRVRTELMAAGLKGKWSEVEKRPFVPRIGARKKAVRRVAPKQFKPHVSREGFGGKLNARPISGSWRMRKRR